MWLSRSKSHPDAKRPTRRLVLFGIAALPVSGCGFDPALGENGSLRALKDRVRLDDPEDRNGFIFKSAFEDRNGKGMDFALSYRISTVVRDIGITPERVITGQQIEGSLDFTLTDTATGLVVVSDSVNAFTSFGTTGTTASTAFANEAALERLMVILADQVTRRLALGPGLPA